MHVPPIMASPKPLCAPPSRVPPIGSMFTPAGGPPRRRAPPDCHCKHPFHTSCLDMDGQGRAGVQMS